MNNPCKNTQKWWIVALAFISAVILLNFTVNMEASNDSNIENGYAVTSNQTTGRKFGSCDATNEYFYFTYESDTSRVDAYDPELNYMYTIEFQDLQSSLMYIRTVQDLLYVRLRCGNVYVFYGQEEISRMSCEEAEEKGYSRDWFRQAESRLQAEGNVLYLRDESGEVTRTVQIPETLFSTSGQNYVLRVLVWIGIAAGMYFLRYLFWPRVKKAGNTV